MIHDCSEKLLSVEIIQYISMCKSAREEINNTMGIQSGAYYISQIGVYNFQFENGKMCFPQSVEFMLPDKSSEFDDFFRSGDVVYLPDARYLKGNDFFKNDEKERGFNYFLSFDNGCYGYPKGVSPREIFKLDEAARLAYIMSIQYKKVWNQIGNSWIEIKTS